MPAPSSMPCRRVRLALLGALLGTAAAFAAGAVRAAEHAEPAARPEASAEAPAKDAKPKDLQPKDAPAKDVKARSRDIVPLDARGPRDPLDMLRERLAEKLGATRAPDTANPNVVRVVAKTSAPMITELPEPAAARSARRKAVSSDLAIAVHGGEAPHAAGPAHWDYTGSGGPEAWGQMKPEFSKCSSGTRQSPIDIREGIKVDLEPVQFDYKPSSFRVIDNGHTVQVNVGAGNSIEVMGRRFELVQFHFHRPSEERIDGKQFDMVVHLVHKDLDGKLAVVAVLLSRGSAQPIVQSVWNNLPLEKGEEVAARASLNLNELLPAERTYFTYMGSLTTPPCSEGVLWMVMKNPVQISPDQIGVFARLYPMNARPVQSASGRLIKESN